MAKIHLYDFRTLEQAPEYYKEEYREKGTACGYVRKNVTREIKKVTCKICLRKINE